MAQYARPDADGASNGWTPSTGSRYTCIDEAVADDSDYIRASTSISANPDQTIRLSDVSDPGVSTGHIIKARAKNSGSGTITITLTQGEVNREGGGTVIGTLVMSSLTTSYAEYTYTLSGTEADSITDYTNLWFHIQRSGGKGNTVYVSQAFLETPGGVTVKDGTTPVSQLVITATAQPNRKFGRTPVSPLVIQGTVVGKGPPKGTTPVSPIVVQALSPQPRRVKTTNNLIPQIKILATCSAGKIVTATLTYANGINLNASAITNAAPLLSDNSAGDNSTYYQNTSATSPIGICAMFDLGSALKVGRCRFRFGFKDSGPIWAFDYSDNGTTWTNAYTGLPESLGSNSCTFGWRNEYNFTTIVTSAHRYWRLCVQDGESVGCSSYDVRLGDYRLYDENGNEYVPGAVIKTAQAMAQIVITATARSGSFKGGVPGVQQIKVQALQPQPIRVKTSLVLGNADEGAPWTLLIKRINWNPFIQVVAKSDNTVRVRTARTPVGTVVISALQPQPRRVKTTNNLIPQIVVQALSARTASWKGGTSQLAQVQILSQVPYGQGYTPPVTLISPIQITAPSILTSSIHTRSTPVSPVVISVLSPQPVRLKNQSTPVGQVVISSPTITYAAIKVRSIMAQIVILGTVTGTKGGTRRRVFLIT